MYLPIEVIQESHYECSRIVVGCFDFPSSMFNQRLTLILVACFFISATLAFDMKVRELKRIADRCPWHVSENATAGELNSSDLVVDCGCCRRFNNLWAFSRALAFGYCTQTTIAFRGGHTCIVGATNRVFNFTILRQNSSRSFSPWKYDGDPIAQARQHLSHSIQLVYFQYQGAKNILKSHVAECMRQVRLLACEKHRATIAQPRYTCEQSCPRSGISVHCRRSSHLISSHFISSDLISSYLILSHLISSHLISSHLISSHFISSYLISSHLISSHLMIISSHLIS
eukprot:g62252.t1